MITIVSVKDIAAECGVSVATVSKALNDYSDISEETRNMVKAKAAELGYLPNMAAVALKTNRTYNIGVLFVDEANSGLTHEFFSGVLQGFKSQAEEEGYCITFITDRIGSKKIAYTEYCKYRQLDGVVIACVDFEKQEVLDLVNSGIPVVAIDHVFHDTVSVMSNNIRGVHTLVEYIHQMGHRRVAFIHGGDSSVTRERLTSFYRCVEEFGLEVSDDYVVTSEYHNTSDTYEKTKKLLSLKNPPTCIMFPDDFAAIGGMNAIKSMGLRIPEDVSIVGYDGIKYSQITDPTMTTLVQDTDIIGRKAAKHLIELIDKPKTTFKEKYVVEGKLFIGNSVKRLT